MMKRLIAISVLFLAGCAASAQTRPAAVDVNALLPHHPLYGTIAQYDRQIAALQATLRTRFANADAQIANARAAIRSDLTAEAQRYARSENAVASSLHGSLGTPAPATGNVAAGIQQTYDAQHADVRSTLQGDIGKYRDDLQAQEQAAFARFVDSVNGRTQRAAQARAQELREKESALLLKLAQRDALQRMLIRSKLQTLVLDDSTRKRLQGQLAVLQRREDAAVAVMRAVDNKTLAAYTAQLQAKAASDVASMRDELARRTQANLSARERVLQAQLATDGNLHLPSGGTSASARAGMQAQYASLTHAAASDNGAFAAARDDLTARFNDLQSANAADTQSIESQIGWLKHDREAVRKRMIAQIMYEAQREAKAHGYSQAYAANSAPPGTADITPLVAHDLASLSP